MEVVKMVRELLVRLNALSIEETVMISDVTAAGRCILCGGIDGCDSDCELVEVRKLGHLILDALTKEAQ